MDNFPNVENKVMAAIKSGRVKLRSKYIFLAEKLGLGSALILSVILAVLFFNLILFYLRSSDHLFYLDFGSRGLMAFLDSFPYELVISFIVFLLAMGLIIKKTDWIYRQPIGQPVLFLTMAIMFLGATLTFTRLAEKIERETFRPNSPGRFLRPLMERGLGERKGGIAGRTTAVDTNYLIIQTPRGSKELRLGLLENKLDSAVAIGSWIMAVGEEKEGIFWARQLKIIKEGEMPLVERGVGRFLNKQAEGLTPFRSSSGCFAPDCARSSTEHR